MSDLSGLGTTEAAVLSHEPIATMLRYLQTLIEIGTEKNTPIVFPLPLDLLGGLGIKTSVGGAGIAGGARWRVI